MTKNVTQPIVSPVERKAQQNDINKEDTHPKPLSGSKKVKNKNHSRQNHGEGS